MKIERVLNLPSGRIFLAKTDDNYGIEFTEMQDVTIDGKLHAEVREATDPRIIWKHLVPHAEKWLITVSTQKGCPHKCKFCDVAGLPFKGNLTADEILQQINLIMYHSRHVGSTRKAKIGFARMGEPAWNIDNVDLAIQDMQKIHFQHKWLPCFNTILPSKCTGTIEHVLDIKNRQNGFLHFQISCNSTDENTRKDLFGGADVVPIDELVATINKHKITGRTVTLNFIVMDGVEVSIDKLKKMKLDSGKFVVKLIPLNDTKRAADAKLKTFANYSNYDKLLKLKNQFERNGIPVVVDAIARCEEAGLCCGQLARIFLS
jgi:23S rRNA (adenine2503-C2)-methyltransferase